MVLTSTTKLMEGEKHLFPLWFFFVLFSIKWRLAVSSHIRVNEYLPKNYFLCINVSWDGHLRITPMKPPGGESKLNLKEDDDGEEKEEEQEERCVRWEENEWECKHLNILCGSVASVAWRCLVSFTELFQVAIVSLRTCCCLSLNCDTNRRKQFLLVLRKRWSWSWPVVRLRTIISKVNLRRKILAVRRGLHAEHGSCAEERTRQEKKGIFLVESCFTVSVSILPLVRE